MLPAALRDPICITYLVLKAMDTVEDDMTIPDDVKIPLVRNFYKNLSDKCDHPTRCHCNTMHLLMCICVLPPEQ